MPTYKVSVNQNRFKQLTKKLNIKPTIRPISYLRLKKQQ